MKRLIGLLLLMLIAVSAGLIVLSGYFFPETFLLGLRSILVNWFVIIAAFALIVAAFRLLQMQWKNIQKFNTESLYSWLLVVSMIATVVVILIFGQSSQAALWIINYLILPIETSLIAVLAVFLVYMLVHSLSHTHTLFSTVFGLTSVMMLALHVASLWVNIPWFDMLKSWIYQTWSLGVIRAILIGVALGALTTGIRVLMGADRPFES
jgi:hypothetical protein